MQKIFLLLLALIFGSSITFPQTFTCTIDGQQVIGTDFYFDVYIQHTSGNNIYLGHTDLAWTFDHTNFTNPTVEITEALPFPYNFSYGIATEILTNPNAGNVPNILIINYNAPGPGTQVQFDQQVMLVSDLLPGTKLARLKVSGITNPLGNMDLRWRRLGFHKTIISSFQNFSPWFMYAISDSGTYEDPANAPLPVELKNFSGIFNNGFVNLSWQTQTEVQNLGFEIQKKSVDEVWNEIGFVNGFGNSNSIKEYSFCDQIYGSDKVISYRLKQINNDGSFEYSKSIEVLISQPNKYELSQNFPNPFNPVTTINFSIAEQGYVELTVFNPLGEQVTQLISEQREAGNYTEKFNAEFLHSGIYFCRLNVNGHSQIIKMILMK